MKNVTTHQHVCRLLQGSRWASLLFVLLVLGCSSPADYEGAFSASQQVKGNSESISAPMDKAEVVDKSVELS